MTPNNTQLINIHSHKASVSGEYTLQNIFAHEFEPQKLSADQAYSVGLHPWHIDERTVTECLSRVAAASQLPNVLAIGEAGVDLSMSDDTETQIEIFLEQVKIAEAAKKPIIIHCVRAYDKLLAVKKKSKSKIPWILHGYYSNKQNAEKIQKAGFWFSFGLGLFSPSSKVPDIFRRFPENQLFVETDEANYSIDDVYRQAAELRGYSVEELRAIIRANFKKCFKK